MSDASSTLRPREHEDKARQRFSTVLRELATGTDPTVSIGDVLSAFGDRAFGALMLLFAAPNVFPLPPGTSAVLGAPLLVVTAQLMLGRPTLWMPRFLLNRSISREFFANLTGKIDYLVARAERLLRPRLTPLLRPVPERLLGGACFVLAVILFLPIPFGNIPPGFAISAFALAILERDGVAALVGWFSTVVSLVILAAVSATIIVTLKAFLTLVGFSFLIR